MMICFASKSGQAAYSGKGTILSPFTEVILANIYKQEDFDKLWHNYIITDSRLSTQQPQKNGGYAGNFYFNQLRNAYRPSHERHGRFQAVVLCNYILP